METCNKQSFDQLNHTEAILKLVTRILFDLTREVQDISNIKINIELSTTAYFLRFFITIELGK